MADADAALRVVLFYRYAPTDAGAEAERQRACVSALGLSGRVLVAAEGVNGYDADELQFVTKSCRQNMKRMTKFWIRSGAKK